MISKNYKSDLSKIKHIQSKRIEYTISILFYIINTLAHITLKSDMYMDFLSSEYLSALLAIIVIDLVLAGDNAIVIGLAKKITERPTKESYHLGNHWSNRY